MAALTPAPSSLGLASPALGPWFATDVNLPVPNADLSVTLALNANDHWLPPAGGLLGFFVATNPRPSGLAALRQAAGTPAFTDGAFVALFQLLPEVETRLHSLMGRVPLPTGGVATSTQPTRQRVRYLALELGTLTLGDVASIVHPSFETGLTDADKAASVGLTLSGTTLGNVAHAMADLKRPGTFLGGSSDRLLNVSAPIPSPKLWAFDARGRPIDPGAVAAWWAFLANATTNFTNLWAPGLSGADLRTATRDAQLGVHLTNAHEGPLRPFELNRLSMTNALGTGNLRSRDSTATAALTVAFTAAPSATPPTTPPPDDLPQPAVALLPIGTYAGSLSLWATGPVVIGLERDFVRIGIVGVEEQLIGQRRVYSGGNTAETRRAQDQHRESTRVFIGRASAPALLTTADGAADAVTGVFGSGTGIARLVTGVADRDWAGLDAPSLATVAPPMDPPSITVRALTGGGTAGAAGTIAGQRVLVEVALGPSLANAWVRAWPQGFDPDVGRHVRLAGGGGRALSDGTALLVMTLPDGGVTTDARMGVDVLVVTAAGRRFHGDLRYTRPAPIGGTAVASGATTSDIVACEVGQTFNGGTIPAGAVPSGATLLVRSTPPALFDVTTLPTSAFTADTLVATVSTGDIVRLTQPAFVGEPEGDAQTTLATIATVTRDARGNLVRVVAPGSALPTMERLEIAVARVGATDADSAVATTPAVRSYHELPPAQAGHVGAPASPEIHGTGVRLTGDAAIAVAEYVRDRTAPLTTDLVTAAATPMAMPNTPPAPSLWAAPLRTVAAGVEGEIGLGAAVMSQGYVFGDTLQNSESWVNTNFPSITLPTGVTTGAASIARALDRRMLAAGRGSYEAAISLREAFRRAEDFVYIESPAIDGLTFGTGDEAVTVWQALLDRMNDRRNLVVCLCVPVRLLPGTPAPLQRVRDQQLLAALTALQTGGASGVTAAQRAERVAVFSPSAGPGRSLRLSATTVIIDDAYALTGTTHLWRRGLSFDSSLAVAVFDESLTGGRPTEVRRFRLTLIAERLSMPLALVPEDPQQLVAALRRLVAHGGLGRLTTEKINAPDPAPTPVDRDDMWDRDGTWQAPFDPVAWLASLTVAGQLQPFTTPPPP